MDEPPARARARDVVPGVAARNAMPAGWPDDLDRQAGTLALAAMAGIDLRTELAEAKPQSAWHAAQVVIALGLSREALERWFARVDAAEPFRCEDCTDWRRQRAVWVARSPRQPLARTWHELKHFE